MQMKNKKNRVTVYKIKLIRIEDKQTQSHSEPKITLLFCFKTSRFLFKMKLCIFPDMKRSSIRVSSDNIAYEINMNSKVNCTFF